MPCGLHPEVETGLERCERCGEQFCPDCYVVLRDRPWCAACKVDLVRDLRSGIAPDELPLASVGRRFVGLWVDSFITGMATYAITIPVMLAFGALGGMAEDAATWMSFAIMGITYPVAFGIPLVYEALMLKRRGQTLGKMAINVEVVTPEGGPISPRQAWTRSAMKVLLGSCMGIDYIPALFTRERTCLHDMIAGTRVVSRS